MDSKPMPWEAAWEIRFWEESRRTGILPVSYTHLQVEEERAKLSYSKEEGCYIYKQELDPLAIAETYQIDYITIDDEAGNSNTYYLENGVLADFEDNVISNAQFTVVETEAQDSDAKGPALKNVKAITSQTKPTDEFQVEFEVEDEMGVADVEVTYKNSISQQMCIRDRLSGNWLCFE